MNYVPIFFGIGNLALWFLSIFILPNYLGPRPQYVTYLAWFLNLPIGILCFYVGLK